MEDELVQQIVVHKSGTHEEVVEAVAKASVLAWWQSGADERWERWLAGRFTKTVRRGEPSKVRKVMAEARSQVIVGQAVAYGFLPYTRREVLNWKEMARLQVANFEAERIDLWPLGKPGVAPALVINSSLQMSTGKTAAQVAHGLFAWLLGRGQEARQDFFAAGMPFAVDTADADEIKALVEDPNMVLTINDAGLTEIEPNSMTVVVMD